MKYADKKTDYGVKVKGVEISPDPIARGAPATFSIAATTGILQFYYYIHLACLFAHCFLVSCHYHFLNSFDAWLCPWVLKDCLFICLNVNVKMEIIFCWSPSLGVCVRACVCVSLFPLKKSFTLSCLYFTNLYKADKN